MLLQETKQTLPYFAIAQLLTSEFMLSGRVTANLSTISDINIHIQHTHTHPLGSGNIQTLIAQLVIEPGVCDPGDRV